jgi:hypothetical protein
VADTSLFTTSDDFSQWGTNGNANITLGASPIDLDGVGTNGLGNTSHPLASGTPGSLAVTWSAGGGNYGFFYGPGEQGNPNFLSALGSSGTLAVDYTAPAPSSGTYFQIGLVLNYTGNFGQFFGTSVDDGRQVNGNEVFTATIPYTVNTAGSYSYFQPGLIYNSDSTTYTPFNIDNIRLINNIVHPPTGNGSWKVSGSGTWSGNSAAEWDPNLPDAADNIATFGTYNGTITVPTSVNVSGAVTVGTLNFDNAASYTLNGGTITISTATPPTPTRDVHTAINVLSGSHTINSVLAAGANADPLDFNVVQASSTLSIPNLTGQFYTFTKDGAGTLKVPAAHGVTLLVNAGTVQMIASGTQANVSSTFGISVAPGATLDLANNGMTEDYTGTSNRDTIRGLLKQGYNNGAWNGTGITSSSAAAASTSAHKTAIGYADTADPGVADGLNNFTGLALDGTTIVMGYTLAGDTNLDGTVDTTDFTQLSQNFGATDQSWFAGDFNYDGVINALDFNALAGNFGSTLSAPALGTLVPEPGALALIAATASVFVRRRSR